MASRVLWLRRDLRLCDHPALLAAAGDRADRARVVPLFVVDPALWEPSGAPRRAYLARSLQALDEALDGRLVVRYGDPVAVLPRLAAEAGAGSVHITADSGPYGRRRDAAVSRALAASGVTTVATGTAYAVGPGTLLTGAGRPFQVFTPFRTAWQRHGWPAPARVPAAVRWQGGIASEPRPEVDSAIGPEAGERSALGRWKDFLDGGLADYADARDLPARPGTSRLSAALKFGEIHPRTLLAGLAGRTDAGAESFRSELCWREFHADVLWHRPESARHWLRGEYARMRYDDPDTDHVARTRWRAWCTGRTGYPFVDAGMRQLLDEGWMHNRMRMVVASFLVKHLHLEWTRGARFFMRHLVDGDLASNSHGWQWTAGSGTDAAPYVRVFNPVTQGHRFDPDGDYVRRHVPELRHLAGAAVHEPWRVPSGYARDYPPRVIDLATERAEALARLAELKEGR